MLPSTHKSRDLGCQINLGHKCDVSDKMSMKSLVMPSSVVLKEMFSKQISDIEAAAKKVLKYLAQPLADSIRKLQKGCYENS